MKISCLQENLSRGLAVVGRAVASRATLPVTQNVLLSVDQSMLKLSATNLEIAMTTWVGAMIEEEGSITVPARLLTEFVNSLPNDKIDLELEQGSGLLQISSGSSTAHINITDASEFPPIPTVDDGIAAEIDPLVLKTAITRVAFAAATEESRPVLTGVEIKLDGNKFTMAAADGFRLAVQKGELLKGVPEEMSVIVPARTMNEVNRLIGDREEPVEILMTPAKGQVMFRVRGGDTVEIVSQLLQGTFPNYEQLIPQSYTTRAVMDLPTVLRAARTASIFARDGSNIIRMHLMPAAADSEPPKVEISARSEEVGDNQDIVDLDEIEGEEGKIAFNSRYLLDVLAVLEKGKVALETTTSSSPGVFKPIDSDDYIHVVMPMFVQW
ncbi:MAG: DNA polymerase III subunit beta [Chloroflexi bacterium]|nr:DNA polymerase III subunit beta [Chloroflexota bacterium]MCI0789162.1 DNA polymerase III subunit beta [Chloroflexota bacterium]MCI0812147.1 DNA polymerase III subunit beta [Chloroflexota bacterium]MCI0829181.1 DNA polymerase III subunit beta [Chloroflexota bacterium]MCI0849276.1 DNA polymerase III subunit beta [Chloroflexota bacterium]